MTVKRKLLVLFGTWVTFCAVVGVWALREVDRLGRAIDVIMRENYRSVVLCQQVAESVELTNGALLSAFAGKAPPDGFFEGHAQRIATCWEEERRNVTVPREGELVEKVSENLAKFGRLQRELAGLKDDSEKGLSRYAREMVPLLGDLRQGVDGIRKLNQDRMQQADVAARTKAEGMFRTRVGLLVFGLLFFCFLSWVLTRWIQAPLKQVLDMCDEIGRGNFSLALKSGAKDEIGQLMRSFNDMASFLRSGRSHLEEQIRQSEQFCRDVLTSLPLPLAVFGKDDASLRFATAAARELFPLATEGNVLAGSAPWLGPLFARACRSGRTEALDGALDRKRGETNLSFQARAVPLPPDVPPERQTDVVVFLQEMSSQLRQQELEYRIVLGFSLRFKKLVDDILMSAYVLLEGKAGELTDKQTELLANIREDALKMTDVGERVLRFHQRMADADGCSPTEAVRQALERFRADANQREIVLTADCAGDLPSVRFAPEDLGLVLNQLLGNALRHTPAGGEVRVSAAKAGGVVELAVADSGPGIPPELRTKIFEPFFTGGGKTGGHLGLGLSFVRESIVRAGGDTGVRDREGGGAVVWFTLPPVVGGKEETC